MHHIYVFTILALFLAGVASKADAVETWAKVYGGFATATTSQTSDGGYIVSGGVSGIGRGVVKIDQHGEIEWQKILQVSSGGNKMVAKQTQDGGYLLAFDTIMSFDTKKWDIVVIKFDQYGNILWQNLFGTADWEAFSDLELTNDGGFLIIGSHYNYSYSDSLVIKSDSSGNIEWQKTYSLKLYDFGRYIAQTSDGGIIVVGDAFSPNQSTDVFMLRLDNLGNVLWQKALGGSGSTDSVGPRGFAITPDDGYILATLYSTNAIIHKFDSNGTLQWQKSYAQADPNFLSISGIKLTYDGTDIHNGYILSGSHSTFKLDLYGNIQWQKPYGWDLFEVTSDGGIFIGEFEPNISKLLKLDENGDILNCQIDLAGSSDVIESALSTQEKNLYLNYGDAASIREASNITVSSQNVLSYSACADSPPPSVLSIMKPGWPAQGNVTADVGILVWVWNGGTEIGTARYPKDTMVTLTATPNIGSVLSGWNGGGCSGTGDCQVTLSGDTNVTATFGLASYTVTPSAGANVSLSPSTPQTVFYNQTTWFTVTPAVGYRVDSVTGCGGSLSGNTYVTGPITANCTVVTQEIAKAVTTVTLSDLNQTYDGIPKVVTVTTDPAGLAFDVTYNGSGTLPTNAGTYTVIAAINEANYYGSASGTLVVAKAAATVTLSDLNQTYTGTPRAAIATINPAGLAVNFTYNGSATAPKDAGSYAVVGTINDLNYEGSATGTLVIAKDDQAISFTCPATANLADRINLKATADSKLAVTLTVTSGPGVINGSRLTFTGTGTVVVTASQAGDNNYNPAVDVQTTINVL